MVKINISNTLKDRIKKSKKMFDGANYSIKILGGNLGSLYVPQILSTLENKAKEGVSIEIISGPNINVKNIKKLKEIPNVQFYKINHYPKIHFSIIDRKILQIEVPHKEDALPETKESVFISGSGMEYLCDITNEGFENLKEYGN